MAVLAKVNFQSQQRVDLSHMLAEASFAAFDFRAMLQMMNGLDRNYVINGFEVNGVSGLSVSLSIANAMLLSPLDGTVAFFTATADDVDEQITLPPSTTNVFIEGYIERDTRTPVTTGFFDPSVTTEDSPEGTEFTASVDFQQYAVIKFRFKTDSFSADAIPICKVSTNATEVTTVTDARNLFFRLGSGGASPNAFNKFNWSETREESSNPGAASAIGTFSSGNPYFVNDASGAKNDKAIQNMKEWMDAVMTVIAEIKGTPTWYFPTSGQTIPNVLFLTGNATTIMPLEDRTIQWSRGNDEILRTKGGISAEPTTWAMNFGFVKWYLGASFVSSATRRFSDKDWTVPVANDEAIFLLLERETLPPNVPGNSVTWGAESISPQALVAEPDITKHIKGIEGDFTGIAIGDYVRKEGDAYFEYYRVVGLVESGLPVSWPAPDALADNIDHPDWGTIATDACTGLLLERSIATTTTEPYKWFRASYSQEDVYKSNADRTKVQSNSGSPLVIDIDDINLFWLGRRSSSAGTETFLFRGYGNMSPGEEIGVLDDSYRTLNFMIPDPPHLRLDTGAHFTAGGDLTTLNTRILTLNKRKRENTTDFGVTNQNAWQEFVIDLPAVNFAADGDGLWVRLEDTVSATTTLTAGDVNPAEPAVPVQNVYEVLPETENPLRNLRNENIFLLARRVDVGGTPTVQFYDGTLLQAEGVFLNREISKVISGVATSTNATTTVTHGYQFDTSDFVWSAKRSSTGRRVFIGADHTATGLELDETPGGVEDLTVIFSRHLT